MIFLTLNCFPERNHIQLFSSGIFSKLIFDQIPSVSARPISLILGWTIQSRYHFVAFLLGITTEAFFCWSTLPFFWNLQYSWYSDSEKSHLTENVIYFVIFLTINVAKFAYFWESCEKCCWHCLLIAKETN